jgi:hypothetical protein
VTGCGEAMGNATVIEFSRNYMLETLISSKTRIKLLLRLFLNPSSTAYLRGMAEEFDESTNSVRLELNRFEHAGMLLSESKGNKKLYMANKTHPLYKDINNILLKYIGIDQIIDTVIVRLGNLDKVYMTGDYAIGKESNMIDLIFVGKINKDYLIYLVEKAEKLIGKKVRFLTYEPQEWDKEAQLLQPSSLLLWENKIAE